MVKKTLLSMAIAAAVVSLAGCNVSSTDKYDNNVDLTPATAGQAGSTPSSFSPIFSAANSQVPLAIDILFADAGDSDGTANTADSTPPVTTAINKLDGFSTVAPIYIEFNSEIDADTVVAGKTVFLVKLANSVDNSSIDALDIDTILAANPANPFSPKPITPADYEARAIDMNGTPAIQVLLKKPLEAKTKYLVVVTSGVKSRGGLNAGMSAEFSLVSGSLELPSEALAPVRGAVQGWQQLASAFLGSGSQLAASAEGSSVLSYTFTTGGVEDVLHSMAAPGIFMAKQLPTYVHAEGAITQSAVAKGVATALAGLPEGATAEQIETATNAGTLGGQNAAKANFALVAQGVGLKLNAANSANPQWTPLPLADGTALRAAMIANDALRPYYHSGLITAIADGQGEGLDTIVSKPQTRVYNPILAAPNTALPIPYDTLFESQITPEVAKQITSVVVGEGAMIQSLGETAGNVALGQIAMGVAQAINTANAATPGWTDLPEDGTSRDALKAKEAFHPAYIGEIRNQIVGSMVADMSSKGTIYQGGLTIPNYLPASETGTADGELGTWIANEKAAKALGLDAAPKDVNGTTNVTYRFPFAKNLGEITIPVMATLPADAGDCAKSKFTDGYPVVIYQHGITVDRTAGLLVGNALAKACVAMVAIDHAMHGVGPGSSAGLVFNVEKVEKTVELTDPNTYAASPFAAVRTGTLAQDADNWMKNLKERHNNVGKNAAQENVSMVFKNAKGVTAEADVGASGDLYINLNNFARTRDAMRQTVLDMLNLSASIKTMDIDASGDLSVDPITGVVTNPDLDASKVYFIGHSLGAIIGTTFVAVNNHPDVQTFNSNLPKIQGAILGNGGGGVVKLLENSPSIGGAKILPGLRAAAGLEQGSADIEKFFGVMQAMVDSADPINFAGAEHMKTLPILSYEAVGGVGDAKPDLVVPNNALNATVATAKSYLAGTDALVSALGITDFFTADTEEKLHQVTDPTKESIRVNVRVGTGDHSTFSNADPQNTFKEIYGQIGSFILSDGKAVNVADTSVLEPVAE